MSYPIHGKDKQVLSSGASAVGCGSVSRLSVTAAELMCLASCPGLVQPAGCLRLLFLLMRLP